MNHENLYRFYQGTRHTGKTTLVKQAMEELVCKFHYATADEPALKDHNWLEQQWETSRFLLNKTDKVILFLDEIQKIPGWSETVKRLWDEDTLQNKNILLVILGSSPLLLERGLTETLAGRFEVIPVVHWSFTEMNKAFGWDINKYIFWGGYPGSAGLVDDHERWARYIKDSLIETTISKDILLMTRVDKPALLRRLFELGCSYSGQILSYQKMLGQLQDVGNATTLAHYLDLLSMAGFIVGISKFSGQKVRQKSSSPKLLVLNTALMSAISDFNFKEVYQNKELWGRWVESSVGAHLVNGCRETGIKVFYWLDRNREVDFVLAQGNKIVAIEVKSGKKKAQLPGMEAKILVGGDGIALEDFFSINPSGLF